MLCTAVSSSSVVACHNISIATTLWEQYAPCWHRLTQVAEALHHHAEVTVAISGAVAWESPDQQNHGGPYCLRTDATLVAVTPQPVPG